VFDEILARQGNPEEIRQAIAEAISERLGEKMPLQAIVISAGKENTPAA
jgi:hypothetical protein